jgi:hypothetical protein
MFQEQGEYSGRFKITVLWDVIMYVGPEVLTAVVIWEITSCSPLKVNPRFEVIYHLNFHGRKIRRGRNQSESRWQAEPTRP